MTSTTETYFLMVLEARNLKPKCWQGHTSSKGFRGGSPLTSSGFWWPWAFLGSWLHPSMFMWSSFLYVSVSKSPSLPFSCKDTVIGFRAYSRLGQSYLHSYRNYIYRKALSCSKASSCSEDHSYSHPSYREIFLYNGRGGRQDIYCIQASRAKTEGNPLQCLGHPCGHVAHPQYGQGGNCL